jgi:hypothetical protein
MTVAERLHSELMDRLAQARQAMKRLACGCPDWTATTMMEMDLDHLESTCREFSACHYGIGLKRQVRLPPTQPKPIGSSFP